MGIDARFGTTCKSKFLLTIVENISFTRTIWEGNETWGH
jgi:hypothetical protein